MFRNNSSKFAQKNANMDDKRYLLGLIREGEHQQQDFKYRVEKSVSAFANTDGGRLLIGVRDDGHLSGVRSEEEIFMMHQAAYKYCKPEASIKFDTYHVDKRTIVIATVTPSERKPIYAINEKGEQRAYIRITDENIVASPVHLAIWREQLSERGAMVTYSPAMKKLLNAMASDYPDQQPQSFTLNQLVRRSRLPRPKVITLLARFFSSPSSKSHHPFGSFRPFWLSPLAISRSAIFVSSHRIMIVKEIC